MVIYFRVFFLLFFPLLAIFFIIQFSVHPFLQGYSAQKLVSEPEGLPKQVVLLVIDSLRYSYSSRFGVIMNTIKQFPESTFLAKSKVGTPTMTTQRIQSLMTGSEIFSIGNILRTFEASKVKIDNLLWQLSNQHKKSAVFGDNTWKKLFDFSLSTVCTNSFDIFDLDTCDNLIQSSLPQQIRGFTQKDENPDFIIAHFLGIDHVGHSTSSITHPKMQAKINEFSKFLQNLFTRSAKGTLFLITGDHAMRSDGNHGGSSQQQIQTLIFAYYKGSQFYQQAKKTFFSQIQLTSTLSILLDIPLPVNSMGSPIFNLLPRKMMKRNVIQELNKNVFKHYLAMLKFYGFQVSQSLVQGYLSYFQDESLITKHEQILEQMVKKLEFLRFSTPNLTQIITVTISMSVLTLAFIFLTFSQELLALFLTPSVKTLMNFLCTGFSLFTLFACYLSWLYTKHLSDCLIFGLFLAIFIGIALKKDHILTYNEGVLIMLCVFLLIQTEPNQSYEFKPSIFRSDLLHIIISSKAFCFILISGQFFLFLSYMMKNMTNEHMNEIKTEKGPSVTILFYIKIVLATLSYLNFIAFHILEKPFYILPQLISLLACLLISGLATIKTLSYTQKVRFTQFLLLNLLSLFIGKHFPLILLVCLIIERKTKDYCTSQVIMSLLAKCVWWWPLGNRYQYSGVDILRTYVYSQNYSKVLNGVSLIVYINAPFILNLLLINSRLLEESFGDQKVNQSRHSKVPIQDEEQEEISKQKIQCAETQVNEALSFGNIRKLKPQIIRSNCKYVSVLLVGLVGSLWATISNNQQLLLTIMCAPLLVLITLITSFVSTFVLILTFWCK